MLKQTSPNELDALKLLEAQALIERGWCQRALHDGNGFCALGAINQAITGDYTATGIDEEWGRRGAYLSLAEAVTGNAHDIGGVVNWNNAPERTQAEVVEAFGRAAEIARTGQLA